MTERCIVRVKFTAAGGESLVRRAVSGFLRYVQHRDLHPTEGKVRPAVKVSGLVKYVAYRDQAVARAELFGSQGLAGTRGRKEFVDYVTRSVADSRAQLFKTRDGELRDRRRAVYRLIISPERSAGLDLEALTRVAMDRLAADAGISDLRWIAAIHRNTAHHHVHVVVAGMQVDSAGLYRRLELSKARLGRLKQAVGLEIERQRGERTLTPSISWPSNIAKGGLIPAPALECRAAQPTPIRIPPLTLSVARMGPQRNRRAHKWQIGSAPSLRLQAVARRYQRQLEQDAEEEARRHHWELAA